MNVTFPAKLATGLLLFGLPVLSLTGCKQTPETASAPAAATTPINNPPAKVKPPVVMEPPAVKAHLYDDDADPNKMIAAAVKQAGRERKHVLLDFGGDWCGDCQVLDIYMHRQPNEQLVRNNYVVVHISVGNMDKNLDVAEKYGVPVSKGVPALAVLDEKGKLLYSQRTGEFEAMRRMHDSSVTEFLDRWKA